MDPAAPLEQAEFLLGPGHSPLVVELYLSYHAEHERVKDALGRTCLVRAHPNDPCILECKYPLTTIKRGRHDTGRAYAQVRLTNSSLNVPGGLRGYLAALIYEPSEEKPNGVLFVGPEDCKKALQSQASGRDLEPEVHVLLEGHLVWRNFKEKTSKATKSSRRASSLEERRGDAMGEPRERKEFYWKK